MRKLRVDAIIPKIKDKVIELLENTTLSCSEIGNSLKCSRGPIYTILKKYNVNRNKYFRNKMKKCKYCGKQFKSFDSKSRPNRSKYCNKECYTKWQKSEANRGKNNPSWVDGGKHESYIHSLRKRDEWKDWRTNIYERDDYTCKICNTKGGILHPHHIIPKSHRPELIFDTNNGITLCSKCHTTTKGLHSRDSKYQQILMNKL